MVYASAHTYYPFTGGDLTFKGSSKTMNAKHKKTVTKTASTKTRRDRWREHIERVLADNAECNRRNGRLTFIPSGWIEEVEGRPLVDVILDWICDVRGYGVKNPNPLQKIHFKVDEMREREYSKRMRDKGECEDVRREVASHTLHYVYYVSDRDLHAFIRKFYHKGDVGMDSAIGRAVKAALSKRVA